jgi:hypothetical protein
MRSSNIKRGLMVGAIVATAFGPAASALAAPSGNTVVNGTLSGAGGLAMVAPDAIELGTQQLGGNAAFDFSGNFTDWSVSDGTGTSAGWNVTVDATDVTRDAAPVDQTGIALNVSAPAIGVVTGPAATTGITAGTSGSVMGVGAVQVLAAEAGAGEGSWLVDAAAGAAHASNGKVSLQLPYDAKAGVYSSTLTFTVAAPVV